METLEISMNGRPLQCPSHHSLHDLLARMGLAGKRLAVECNGAIVPKSAYAAIALAQGDRLEIVVAVGGG
jgi:sulfur carrier protein